MKLVSLVTWVSTPVEVARLMFHIANIGPEDVVCDLGAGDGLLLIMSVKDFGAKKAIGYEIRPDLCREVRLKARLLHMQHRIRIIQKPAQEADFSQVSVITIYLTTEANEILRPHLETKVKPGTRIVSYLFPIGRWQSIKEIDLAELTFREAHFVGKLYLYEAPQSFLKGR